METWIVNAVNVKSTQVDWSFMISVISGPVEYLLQDDKQFDWSIYQLIDWSIWFNSIECLIKFDVFFRMATNLIYWLIGWSIDQIEYLVQDRDQSID